MLKRFTQVLPYVVCTQVRTHVHKRITKTRYGTENPGRFVFGKPVLFTLGWDLLRLTLWVFWSEIFTRHRHCVYWVLAEVWVSDPSHKIGNKFLRGIWGKHYFGRIFQKFCANQGYPLPKLVKFRPSFSNFYSGSVLRWKGSHKYFHMWFAPR